jgi:hypothetical protein
MQEHKATLIVLASNLFRDNTKYNQVSVAFSSETQVIATENTKVT